MSDLVSRLRGLSACKHSDLSIGNEAADRIEALEAGLAEAKRDADDNYRQGVLLGVRYMFKYLNFQAPVDYRIDEMVDAAIKARGA